MVTFFSETHRRLHTQGKAEGRAEGKAEGRAEGKAEGRAEGKAEALLKVLAGRGLQITAQQRHRITSCTRAARLDRWLAKAGQVTSVAVLLGVPSRTARRTGTTTQSRRGTASRP